MFELPSLQGFEALLRSGVRRALSPGERLSLFILAPTFALGAATLALAARGNGRGLRGLWRDLFPRSVWLHPSALLDYKYLVFTALVYVPLVSPLMVSSLAAGRFAGQAWDALLGAPAHAASATLSIVVLYTVVLELVSDLRRYLVHVAFHRFPLLWQFHKTHHSAETLTPVTFYRVHPVELYVNATAGVLAIALVTGAFQHYVRGLTALTILGANAGRFVFDLLGSNLRHSHVWLSYGSWLEHVLISPAQHQIHHSDAERHLNKNYGSEFALWDWLFGTLYVPRGREQLRFGIGPDERPPSSLWQLCANPFRQAWATLRGS
jgi:sterol desaturase/sphingolipid hydroxylase (fatty acid hydroxylase superfamily)